MHRQLMSLALLALAMACSTTPGVDAGPEDTDAGPLSLTLSFGELDPPFEPLVREYTLRRYSALVPQTLTVTGTRAASLNGARLTPGVPANVAISTLRDTLTVQLDGTTHVIRLEPPSFPVFTHSADASTPGWLYLTPAPYLLLLDQQGRVLFYDKVGDGSSLLTDFKRQVLRDGGVRHTYLHKGEAHVLDARLQPLRTFQMVRTALNDSTEVGEHDVVLLDDDHVILQSYVKRRVQNIPPDLQSRDGGAFVLSAYVQEQRDGAVLFEWDSSEHPELYRLSTENNRFVITASPEDYAHLNSVMVDPLDQHLVLSFRHLDAVLKVERPSGRILWRLGGGRPDAGIPDSFATPPAQRPEHQHTAYLVGPDRLTLLDNRAFGNSRVATYQLDPDAGRLLAFSELPLPAPVVVAGSAQPLDGGRVLVGLGIHPRLDDPRFPPEPDVLELDATTGAEHRRLRFEVRTASYRAALFPALPLP